MIDFSVLPICVTDKEAFFEASREELRVLLALIEKGGRALDEEELARAANISRARASAALVFWQESGVISKRSESTASENFTRPTVTEEFEERIDAGEIIEAPAVKVAKSIRDNELSELIEEIAAIMQKPALATAEIKKICAVYEEYSLSEDYIITLAAYLAEKGKLTASRLAMEAERLIKKGVDCTELLEKHIIEKQDESATEYEFKQIVGIRDRKLSQMERDMIHTWYSDFGFSNEVISLAYSINTMQKPFSMLYMNTILKHWNEQGCKTLEECQLLHDREVLEKRTKRTAEEKPYISGTTKTKKQTPRYGEFDVNDAFAKALKRSYGEEGKK